MDDGPKVRSLFWLGQEDVGKSGGLVKGWKKMVGKKPGEI